MIKTLSSMLRDEEGASMVEYALLLTFIAIVALAGTKILGTNLNTLFSTVANTI